MTYIRVQLLRIIYISHSVSIMQGRTAPASCTQEEIELRARCSDTGPNQGGSSRGCEVVKGTLHPRWIREPQGSEHAQDPG